MDALGGLDIEARELADGVFAIRGEVFAAAVWRNPKLVSNFEVSGAPVVWNAGEGVTLLCGADSVEGFGTIAELILKRLQNEVEFETPSPHQLVDGAWQVRAWPAQTQETVATIERLFAQRWCERQRRPLTAYYEARGIEVNVPEFRVMESPSGDVVSMCACVEGVNNAIPEVDTVLVVRPDGAAQPYPFEEFKAAVAVPLQDAEVLPRRWITQGVIA